ncbi:aldose 1-epimerase family protein [Lactobacillus sp. UCMA15818]|uniref:aldose 1-epimerase family protein n=1 Tax=Lactobacillus sp. UCMA15818 TaxID=2583394 RepID=UPI0025B00A65|nr:aldose 1-epimerase family protein [Lactobacillus sp. UCMA15818]
MITIENNHYKVNIDQKGGQLINIIDKRNGLDYLWNGQEWPKHAPLLFPAIGRSNKDSYLFNGQAFNMPQHGFGSDEKFEVTQKNDSAVTFELRNNATTQLMYPFSFSLKIRYQLLSTGLSVSFKVTNLSSKTMPFALGSHPAFNIPIADAKESFEDYHLEFVGNKDKLQAYEIVMKPFPYRTGKIELLPMKQKHQLKLSRQLFANGLRVIANRDITEVKLVSDISNNSISLRLGDFNNVCLWTKEDQPLPFLCIEPFNGLPDVYGEPVDWMKKDGNLFLKPAQSKLMQYEIIFGTNLKEG